MHGAEFSEGEQTIVFLGAQDRVDGSYDILGGRRGKFVVQRDESGRPVLDVRLGADASAYGRAEKAPGTGLARVPVEVFAQLAAGAAVETAADFQHAQAGARDSSRASELSKLSQPPGNAQTRSARSQLHVLFVIAILAAVSAAGWLVRRRTR